jgi:predicted Zn-dependent protease
MQQKTKKWLGALVATAALVATGCATVQNPVTGRQERTVMDEAAEIRAGQEADQQVREEYGVYENAALQAYVNEVGQKLAAQSHRANLKWSFTVVDSPEINAFALPGGYVYITRGLMAYLNSEAELAGVLGHEIGHVTARHASQRATRAQTAGIGVLAASVLGAVLESRYGVGGLGEMAQQGAGAIAQTNILSYGREQELQSDELGAEYLHRTRQDPSIMYNVLNVLKQNDVFTADQQRAAGKQVNRMPTYLSSHPSNEQRLQEITRIAAKYKSQNVPYADPGRQRYLQAINGMTFGDSKTQGMVRGNVFYHEGLGFVMAAPAGWEIQNGAQQLLFVSRDSQAAVVMVPSNTRGDLDAAIRQLKPDSGRVDRLTINGLPAVYFNGTSGGKPLEVTAVSLRGTDYLMRPLAKQGANPQAYFRDQQAVINSFRPFTANDAGRARVYTLRTTAMPQQGFRQLAQDVSRSAPDVSNPEGQVRLLNQAYPQGNAAPGSVVKTVQ